MDYLFNFNKVPQNECYQNIGNSCYINSALQCLRNVGPQTREGFKKWNSELYQLLFEKQDVEDQRQALETLVEKLRVTPGQMGDPRLIYQRIIIVTMNGLKNPQAKKDLLQAFYWTEVEEDDDDQTPLQIMHSNPEQWTSIQKMATQLNEYRSNYPTNLVFGLDPIYTGKVKVDDKLVLFSKEGKEYKYRLMAYIHSSSFHATAFRKQDDNTWTIFNDGVRSDNYRAHTEGHKLLSLVLYSSEGHRYGPSPKNLQSPIKHGPKPIIDSKGTAPRKNAGPSKKLEENKWEDQPGHSDEQDSEKKVLGQGTKQSISQIKSGNTKKEFKDHQTTNQFGTNVNQPGHSDEQDSDKKVLGQRTKRSISQIKYGNTKKEFKDHQTTNQFGTNVNQPGHSDEQDSEKKVLGQRTQRSISQIKYGKTKLGFKDHETTNQFGTNVNQPGHSDEQDSQKKVLGQRTKQSISQIKYGKTKLGFKDIYPTNLLMTNVYYSTGMFGDSDDKGKPRS